MPDPTDGSAALAAFLKRAPDTTGLELMLPDINGILRGKRVTRKEMDAVFARGIAIPGAAALLDWLGQTHSSIRYGGIDGDPDVPAFAVTDTLVPVPWASRPLAQVMLRLEGADGKPWFADSRTVLHNAWARLRAQGLRPVVAVELEFYLLQDDGPHPRPYRGRIHGTTLERHGPQFGSLDDLQDLEPFSDTVAAYCAAQNLPATTVVSEYGTGQMEINLAHQDDPALACDQALMLKRVVRQAAREHGLAATFMAKPFAERAGCGQHLHVSLLDKDGVNVFAPTDESEAFSPWLAHAVGGLAAAMPESMAIFAPNANSYRRLRPGFLAPLAPTWGMNHRQLAMRIPLSNAANTRIEHRVAGADANPWLTMAAVLAAIDHGLAEKCDPGPMVPEGGEASKKVTLPVRWGAALDAFEHGRILPPRLGGEYCAVYASCRREDSQRFHAEVSDRDYAWYLATA